MINADPGSILSTGTGAGISSSVSGLASDLADAAAVIARAPADSIGSGRPSGLTSNLADVVASFASVPSGSNAGSPPSGIASNAGNAGSVAASVASAPSGSIAGSSPSAIVSGIGNVAASVVSAPAASIAGSAPSGIASNAGNVAASVASAPSASIGGAAPSESAPSLVNVAASVVVAPSASIAGVAPNEVAPNVSNVAASIAAAPSVSIAAVAASVASSSSDSIGGAPASTPDMGMAVRSLSDPALPQGSTVVASVPRELSQAARLAVAMLERSLSAAGVSSSSALRSPANLRALAALSQQSLAVLLAAPQSSGKAALLQLASVLRALLSSGGPSEAAIGNLRGFLAQHPTGAVLALLAAPAQTAGPALPAIGLPTVLAAHAARSQEKEAAEESDRDGSRKRNERPASARERRLAELALDPRRGVAPEGVAAYEAECQEGLCLQRCPTGEHDFVDETGAAWDVVAPTSPLGLEATLRALQAHANLILSLQKLNAGECRGAVALARRVSAAPGARRLIALEADAQGGL